MGGANGRCMSGLTYACAPQGSDGPLAARSCDPDHDARAVLVSTRRGCEPGHDPERTNDTYLKDE